MDFSEAVQVAARTYGAKARAILPFYFFVPSAAAIARVVPLLGIVVAVYLLQQSGALAEIRDEFAAVGPIAIDESQQNDPFADPGAPTDPLVPQETTDAIGDVLAGEPLAVGIVLVALLSLYLIVPAILWVSAAGRLHGIASVLTDPEGTPADRYFDSGGPRSSVTRQAGASTGGQSDPGSPENRSEPRSPEDRPGPRSPEDRPGPHSSDEQPRSGTSPTRRAGEPTDASADRPDRDGPRDRRVGAGNPNGPIGDPGRSSARRDLTSEATERGSGERPRSPVERTSSGRPLRDAVDGTFTHALTFLALLAVELLVLSVSFALTLLFLVVPPIGALLVLGWLFLLLPAVRTYFAFAKSAAVVDGVGVSGALSGAGGFFTDRLGQAVAYGFLSAVSFVGIIVLLVVFSALDAGAAASVLGFLVVFPVLDAVKTALYIDYADGVEVRVPGKPEGTIRTRLRAELESGLAQLRSFTLDHPAPVVANAVLFALGAYLAWRWAAGLGGVFEASIERRASGNFPPGMMLNYFANNWSVGIAQAFSGVGLGVPSVLSVVFNGLLIGAYFRIEVVPLHLLAFIVPHGLIEIPALILSGALGLYLGAVVWRYLRGRADREDLADEIRYAYEVTLGLAVLFAAAAVIEGFFSPYYWRLLGI